jgi:hypothetical protein
MSQPRQTWFCLAILAVALNGWSQTNPPIPAPLSGKSVVAATNLMPPMPAVQSPVSFFRQLLMMSPAERNDSLASRTPEARARILAKVREYKALNPDEREVRLGATELRWYLTLLMPLAPADRSGLLAQVPPELQPLVKSRLLQWDVLPPSLKDEFLANEKTLHYLTQTSVPSATNTQPDRIAGQFSQILELTAREKQHLLGMLSATERAQMEKTLQTFDQLPVQQRTQCIRNYAKFAGMSGAERAEFLKNAESWSKMSPQERQAWRDLVANVPLWPPAPAAIPPPLPPRLPPSGVKPHMATN